MATYIKLLMFFVFFSLPGMALAAKPTPFVFDKRYLVTLWHVMAGQAMDEDLVLKLDPKSRAASDEFERAEARAKVKATLTGWEGDLKKVDAFHWRQRLMIGEFDFQKERFPIIFENQATKQTFSFETGIVSGMIYDASFKIPEEARYLEMDVATAKKKAKALHSGFREVVIDYALKPTAAVLIPDASRQVQFETIGFEMSKVDRQKVSILKTWKTGSKNQVWGGRSVAGLWQGSYRTNKEDGQFELRLDQDRKVLTGAFASSSARRSSSVATEKISGEVSEDGNLRLKIDREWKMSAQVGEGQSSGVSGEIESWGGSQKGTFEMGRVQ